MPPAPWSAERLSSTLAAGLLVAGGAAAMSFLAVAMASGGADLSDDQSPAVGPTTIYAFLLVGGLYNLVLTGDGPTRAAGLALYLVTLAAYWRDGVARAEICFDAEAIRAPRLRVADGATLALVLALGSRGFAHAAAAAAHGDVTALGVVAALGIGFQVVLATVGVRLLRRAGGRVAMTPARWGLGIALGAAAGALSLFLWPPGQPWSFSIWVGAGLRAAGEEIVWRGVLQGAVERALAGRLAPARARLIAALVGFSVGAATLVLVGAVSGSALLAQATAAAARGLTGSLAGALSARLAIVGAQLVGGVFP